MRHLLHATRYINAELEPKWLQKVIVIIIIIIIIIIISFMVIIVIMRLQLV